ncbi:SH3 domain-containing protein [Streptomyces sp. KR80]|uniref:SH3 domain-containing protein n=1 Tax=Streptomyces sp. KR80 TaxID=3457426 RepID=UPI003FD58BED
MATDGLRLRAAPSFNGRIKGLLCNGDRVFVRIQFHPSYNRDWVGVVLTQKGRGGLSKRTFGYVYKWYLA